MLLIDLLLWTLWKNAFLATFLTWCDVTNVIHSTIISCSNWWHGTYWNELVFSGDIFCWSWRCCSAGVVAFPSPLFSLQFKFWREGFSEKWQIHRISGHPKEEVMRLQYLYSFNSAAIIQNISWNTSINLNWKISMSLCRAIWAWCHRWVVAYRGLIVRNAMTCHVKLMFHAVAQVSSVQYHGTCQSYMLMY